MIKYHTEPDGSPLIQGSDEWKAARVGLLTASEMRLVVSPPPKVETRVKKNGEPYKQREQTPAENEACRTHLYELLGQRITGHVEERYIGDEMLRGKYDEIEARILYDKHYAPVQEVGFITNDKWGFTLGYSPDGLVGVDGLVEFKSRRQKFQVQTIVENVMEGTIPPEFIMQIQTGLLVCDDREWCDFGTYSGGMHMATIRVFPMPSIQESILDAAYAFEKRLAEKMDEYRAVLASSARLIPTERKVELEMVI